MFGELDLRQFKRQEGRHPLPAKPELAAGQRRVPPVVKAAGGEIVAALPVQNQQANYVRTSCSCGRRARRSCSPGRTRSPPSRCSSRRKPLGWHPTWLVFPFNLEPNTLAQSSFAQPLWGVATWDAYAPFYHGGPFKPYAKQLAEFERQYPQYDPDAHLVG